MTNIPLRFTLLSATFAALVTATPSSAQCPSDWVNSIGSPGANVAVTELLVLPDSVGGDLIVGGGFNTVGGVSANRIARYSFTSNTWSAFGSGANGNLTDMVALPDGDFVVAGIFTMIDNTPVNTLARYSHATGQWSSLGVNAGVYIFSLAVTPQGDLIAGGDFISIGSVSANRIARYSFSTGQWSPLGAGVDDAISAVTMLLDGDVIAGGYFNNAGGVPAQSIARYNFTTGQWSAMGLGVEGEVRCLVTLSQGDVIVGGVFDYADVFNVINLARYTPSTDTWSTLPQFNAQTVLTLDYLDDGSGTTHLVVGGSFSAGVTGRNNIISLNTTTNQWSALGIGTNSSVSTLAARTTGSGWSDLFVGGAFTSAGGAPANRIARWSRSIPAPTVITQPLPVLTAPGGTALFFVNAVGGSVSASPAYQWRRNGVSILAQDNPSAVTNVLSLSSISESQLGLYDCVITNACGGPSTLSNLVALEFALPEGCPADFNDDGGIDGADIEAFFLRWENGC